MIWQHLVVVLFWPNVTRKNMERKGCSLTSLSQLNPFHIWKKRMALLFYLLVSKFGHVIVPHTLMEQQAWLVGVAWKSLEEAGIAQGWVGGGVRLQDTLGSMLAAAHFHIHRLFIGHPRPTTSQDRVGILPNPGNLASRGKTNKSYVTSSHFSTILCSIWAKKGFDQKKKTQKKIHSFMF